VANTAMPSAAFGAIGLCSVPNVRSEVFPKHQPTMLSAAAANAMKRSAALIVAPREGLRRNWLTGLSADRFPGDGSERPMEPLLQSSDSQTRGVGRFSERAIVRVGPEY
jgi:hypothetical protein